MAGDALVLASAALSALYIVAQTRLLRGRNPAAVTAVQMGAATLVALPLALFAGSLPAQAPPAGVLMAVVALSSAGSLIPFTLYAYGQARVTAEVAGAFVNLEPLVGASVGALAFGEPFGPLQMTGALAIVAGIGLSLVRRRARRPLVA